MRDLIEAVASYRETEQVTVIPRIIARDPEIPPDGVTHLSRSAGSKIRFVGMTVKAAAARPAVDWIVCGHVNLLPVASAAAALSGARIILVVYGMEVWKPRGRVTKLLLSRVFAVVSISEVTIDRMQGWAQLPSHRLDRKST